MAQAELSGNRPRPERSLLPERTYAPHTVNVLRGKSVQIDATDRFGQVSIVTEGVGQFSLTDLVDNKRKSGRFHHAVLTGRIASHFSQEVRKLGQNTNPRLIENAMPYSHAGTWISEQAQEFPQEVDGLVGEGTAEERQHVTQEALGLRLIQGKVPQEEFQLVAALAHDNKEFPVDSDFYNTWDYRLTSYVDHRTTDKYISLRERMAGFFIGNYISKDKVTPELAKKVQRKFQEIIDHQKEAVRNRNGNSISLQDVDQQTLDEADREAEELGASPISSRLSARKDFMKLLLQDAETEEVLNQFGIDTENINDNTVPMPKWEKDIRKDYVAAAKDEIVPRISELISHIQDGDDNVWTTLEQEFPIQTWWGRNAVELYFESLRASVAPVERILFQANP